MATISFLFLFIFFSQATITTLVVSPNINFNTKVALQMKKGYRPFEPRKGTIICTDKPPYEIFCISNKSVKEKKFRSPQALTQLLKETKGLYDKLLLVNPELPEEILNKVQNMLDILIQDSYKITNEKIINSPLTVLQKDLLLSEYKKYQYHHSMDLNKSYDQDTNHLINYLQNHTVLGALTRSYSKFINTLTREETKILNRYLNLLEVSPNFFFTFDHIIEQRYGKNLVYLFCSTEEQKKYGNSQYSLGDLESIKLNPNIINNLHNNFSIPQPFHNARNIVDPYEYNHSKHHKPIKAINKQSYHITTIGEDFFKYKNKPDLRNKRKSNRLKALLLK